MEKSLWPVQLELGKQQKFKCLTHHEAGFKKQPMGIGVHNHYLSIVVRLCVSENDN